MAAAMILRVIALSACASGLMLTPDEQCAAHAIDDFRDSASVQLVA
jgi:hypothetical protein